MDNTSKLLFTLEDLLIKEFQAWKELQALCLKEREALMANQVTDLEGIVEDKEALLDQLSRLDESRREINHELGQIYGIKSTKPGSPSVADLLPYVDREKAERLGRLRDGMQALLENVRTISMGNKALTATAIDRGTKLQAFLVKVLQPELNYRPYGAGPAPDVSGALEIDHKT